jgi:demethylmenaquinone methyltransferase/2-methoxy-6-polyprenyl-1,4-benzoquinol methylase/phosphoethanolamine N-methyltransferase
MNPHATHDPGGPAGGTTGNVIHWARGYDLLVRLLPFSRGLRAQLVELAAPAAGERVLDVGCGTGLLAMALVARVGNGAVHGIDASTEMIDLARKKAARAGSQVDFQVAPVEALPFPDGSFDLVTSSLMLHHLPRDAKRAGLAQIRRVLAPGGRFVAVDFATHSHSPLGHLLSVLGHAHGESTVGSMTPLLKEAGFREVEAVPTRHKRFAFLRARCVAP